MKPLQTGYSPNRLPFVGFLATVSLVTIAMAVFLLGRAYLQGHAVSSLVQSVLDQDVTAIEVAAVEVKAYGAQARAVTAMVELLRRGQATWTAANALEQFGADATDSIPALVNALEDENPVTRLYAASALGAIGPKARAAVPDLTRCTEDKVDAVRIAAALALQNIAGPREDLSRTKKGDKSNGM